MVSVKAPGVNEAKVNTPTVPVPKSRWEPDAVRVRAPTPGGLALPSEKFPLPKLAQPNVIVEVLLTWLFAPSRKVPPEFTVTLLGEPSALAEPSATVKVPPLTVVEPL